MSSRRRASSPEEPASTGESPPPAAERPPSRRRDRPPRRDKRRAVTKKSLEQIISLLLAGGNMVVLSARPDLAGDVLAETEIVQLSAALAEEIWQYPRARAWLVSAGAGVGSHARLVMVVLSIIVTRMAHHDLLPAQIAAVLAQIAGAVESGGAPGAGGGYGDREIDAGEQPAEGEGVRDDTENETR